jgi:hypothetical protein
MAEEMSTDGDGDGDGDGDNDGKMIALWWESRSARATGAYT